MGAASGGTAGPRALVLADDIGVFLAVVRSLGRGGVAVDVASGEFDYPGLSSRYVSHVHRVPPHLSDTPRWLDALDALVRNYDYRLIIPTSDSVLTLLARHADRFDSHRLAIPNDEALAAFTDKAETRTLAQALGVPIAKGIELGAASDPASIERALGLPLVLKPRSPYVEGNVQAKTSAVIVHTAVQLAQALAGFGDRALLAESFFVGDGVGVSVLANRGKIILSWQHRRLAEVSDTGRSSLRTGEAVDLLLLRRVAAMCKATKLTGVAMFEFRHDPASGAHILIEVNARFWGSLPLAVAGGADFPMALWRMLCGNAPARSQAIDYDVRKYDLAGEWDRLSDSVHVAGLGAKARGIGAMIKLGARAIFSPTSFDSWAADDTRPHFADLRRLAGHILETIRRRLV